MRTSTRTVLVAAAATEALHFIQMSCLTARTTCGDHVLHSRTEQCDGVGYVGEGEGTCRSQVCTPTCTLSCAVECLELDE